RVLPPLNSPPWVESCHRFQRDRSAPLTGAAVPDAMGETFPSFGEVAVVDGPSTELLVRLLSRHQEDLFRYVFALLPHEEDARDVLQETSVALCRKFAEYDPAQPFLPWAFRFAYLEVLKQRERNQRGSLLLSRELIERLAAQRQGMQPLLQARLMALEACLEQLPPEDRQGIRQRYGEERKADDVAGARRGRPRP